MDETYTTRAIILKRQPFREQDSRVVVFCFDKGRLDLVARGTVKPTSKLAAHIEPITLSDIMVVKGKKLSYIGGSVSKECFKNIKNDLVKIRAVSEVFNLFFDFIKQEKRDSELFVLLLEFLYILNDDNNCDPPLLLSFFKFKFLVILGYTPELYSCVSCKNKIYSKVNEINFELGGVICENCLSEKSDFFMSENVIKMLRIFITGDCSKLNKFNLKDDVKSNLRDVVDSYREYIKFTVI